ncbi:Hypothetical_protein [Hexamita inflata]|uniref:Hypothetical_protein n=1 Tax=Hexamita inflata TaxID=28002 RepID=A0AA86UDW8_9EUKA|nr:Hypothetical protein HINF_LOCUS34907 [Hexamita inflata]
MNSQEKLRSLNNFMVFNDQNRQIDQPLQYKERPNKLYKPLKLLKEEHTAKEVHRIKSAQPYSNIRKGNCNQQQQQYARNLSNNLIHLKVDTTDTLTRLDEQLRHNTPVVSNKVKLQLDNCVEDNSYYVNSIMFKSPWQKVKEFK